MAKALRVTTFNEPKAVTDVLKSEFGGISREAVTILSGEGVLAIGTVLAKVTASGKYVAHVNGGSGGTEVAVAVLIDNVDATSADVTRAIVIHRLAEVIRTGLVWDASVDSDAKKLAAVNQLAANMIIVREAA